MSVVIALKELHEQGYTHCDIRLDNICFKENRAVLIDLDMGGRISRPYIASSLTKSIMYPRHIRDREKLDWRQLGIMIVHIEEPRNLASYHKTEPNFNKESRYNNAFIKKLYYEGKRSESNMVIVNLISLYYRGHGSSFTY